MGGCASKPKESDSLPSEAPASPTKAEPETIAQENTDGGENQNEAPLVDLSEPNEEAKDSSSADAKPVSEDKVEAVVTEDNVEATEPAKEAEVSDQDKSDAPLVTV